MECTAPLSSQERIACCRCHKWFHYRCVNITKENFSKLLKPNKLNWKCPECKSSSRSDNSNTPMVQSLAMNRRKDSSPTVEESAAGGSSPQIQLSAQQFNVLTDTILKKINDNIEKTVKKILQEELKKFESKLDMLNEFKESVAFLSARHDTLIELVEQKQGEIKDLQTDRTRLNEEVKNLHTRLNSMEQHSRDCNIEIQCVPEHRSENLVTMVTQMAKIISCPLEDKDILYCSRVAKLNPQSSRPKSIIVRLPSPRVRDNFLAAYVKFNKSNSTEKLNSSHIGIASDKKQSVYVQEHLSPSNKELHGKARMAAKEKGYKFVWIRNGRIFIRKNETSPAQWIKNLECITTLE